MWEWPVFQKSTLTPLAASAGSVANRPVDLTSTTKVALRVKSGKIPRQHDADLVGEDLRALVVDDAAAVAVAVEAERDVGARGLHRLGHRVQHVEVLGVRIVAGEGPVEVAIKRNHLDAERPEKFRREGPRSAVAAGGHDFHLPRKLRPAGQVGDVARRKVGHERVGAAGLGRIIAADHDVAQAPHLLGAKGDRPRRAHLHAGPAIVVMRGGDHRHRGNVERELGEIGHRRDGEADIADLRPAGHQPRSQRQLDRGRIAAEVVADHHLARNAEFLQEARQPEAERLHAHQIEFLLEQPARVVFAKSGRLDHRLGFVGVGVGEELRDGFGEQRRASAKSTGSVGPARDRLADGGRPDNRRYASLRE